MIAALDNQIPIKDGGTCPCGNRLPWHLFNLDLGGFSHNCSCDRLFKKVDGVVCVVGMKKNQIAEWDRSHQWDPDAPNDIGTRGAWVPR